MTSRKAYLRRYYKKNKKRYQQQQKKNPRRRALTMWISKLKSDYGITFEEYEAMRIGQRGVCAICKKAEKGRRLSVDHCHKTGRIRGLLCRRCNFGLGQFDDRIDLFLEAASYLKGVV